MGIVITTTVIWSRRPAILQWFGLRLENGDGFICSIPRRHAPTELLPMPDYPQLLNNFRQYGNWLIAPGD
jgi:hypothetical protein